MGQEQERVTAREQQHVIQETQTKSSVNQQAAEEMDILDAVLDDIEDVLQNNAEEYVNSFVQKGGE